MLRRDFLAQLAGAATVTLGCGHDAFAYRHHRHHSAPSPPSKLDRIAISSWSFHNYFRATRESDFNLPGGMLALLDFPEAIADRYHVRHFEFCASHFPSTESAYLNEMKYTLTHARSAVVNLCVDIDACGPDGTFSDPDHKARLEALDEVIPWVNVARNLGVKSVSVGPGKVDPENLDRTAESYKALANYAHSRGVQVLVENQDGFGDEHPEELAKLIRLAGPARLEPLPNFESFPDDAVRAEGLKLFFPLAPSVCHVGGVDSGADGDESAEDFSQGIEIAKQAGFKGFYTIDFDGPADPYKVIQKTLDELLRCI